MTYTHTSLLSEMKRCWSTIRVHTVVRSEATSAALDLGFDQRILPQRMPFNTHGQPGFTDGRNFITPDVDQHNGGVWKMFDRRGNRLGTYDADLNRIGD